MFSLVCVVLFTEGEGEVGLVHRVTPPLDRVTLTPTLHPGQSNPAPLPCPGKDQGGRTGEKTRQERLPYHLPLFLPMVSKLSNDVLTLYYDVVLGNFLLDH